MDRRNIARRVFVANATGVPSIMAGMIGLLSSASESYDPQLLIATCDVLNNINQNTPAAFTTWTARPLIAEVIARVWARGEGIVDEAVILARTYAELVAIANVRTKNRVRDVEIARNYIGDILQTHPPSIVELRSLITEIIKVCRNAGNNVIPAAQSVDVIDHPQDISAQTYMFYRLRGHVIPDTIFANNEFRLVWANLRNPDANHVGLEDVDYEIVADYGNIWRNAGIHLSLGFYEGKAIQNPEKSKAIMAAALFCYITSLAKSSGVTPSWVTRRRRAFSDRLPGINLDNYITEHIVRSYNRHYAKDTATADEVYRQLAMSWSMLQIPEGIPLTWMIEQAANSHVTCLTTIADVVTKLKYFDSEDLIRSGIPITNFRAALRQALDLMRDPFCSIVRPTVMLREYADLAYVCTYIKREHMKDEAFLGYLGQPSAMCTLSAQELQAIGKAVFQMSTLRQNDGQELIDIYKRATNANIREINGEYFLIGELPPIPRPVQAEGAAALEMVDQQEQARAFWPAAARNLPAGTRRVTVSEMFNHLDARLIPRAQAFRTLMQRMYALQTQVPLRVIPENTIQVPSSKRQIPALSVDAFTLWDIDVQQAWRQEVAAYNPAEDQNNIADEALICQPRPAWAMLNPRVPPPPPPPAAVDDELEDDLLRIRRE